MPRSRSIFLAAVMAISVVAVVPAFAHHPGPGNPPPRNQKSCVNKDGDPKQGQGQAKHCYPPATSSARVSSNSVSAGGSLTVSGSGYCNHAPNTVSLSLERPSEYVAGLGSKGAGSSGDFSTSVTIPRNTKPGSYDIVASGLASDCSAGTVQAASITVVDPKRAGLTEDAPASRNAAPWIAGVIVIALAVWFPIRRRLVRPPA